MGVALAAMTAAKTTAQTPVPIRVTPQSARESAYLNAVSYTHLTLPTILLV